MRAQRPPRTPRDPELERQRIEERQLEEWIDEGETDEVELADVDVDDDLRQTASRAVDRAATEIDESEAKRRRQAAAARVDPQLAAAIRSAVGDPRLAARTLERVGKAQVALDRDRLDEARRTIVPIAKTLPGIAGVQRLAGLTLYRLARWRDAAIALDAAYTLGGDVALLPVLADSHRAMRHWSEVERIWLEIRQLSPSHEVMTEGRIVAAGALADRGDLTGALELMSSVSTKAHRVEDHHLRQWYVLADLNDRAGHTIEAARWFERIAAVDDDYFDVTPRLRALGRRRR